MRSKVAQRILDKTPKEVEIFVRMYGDIIVRVQELIKEKNITQKELAKRMGKKPSEISKWLNGNHNLTLRSLAKLQAELGEPIIFIPRKKEFVSVTGNTLSMTVNTNRPAWNEKTFVEGVMKEAKYKPSLAS